MALACLKRRLNDPLILLATAGLFALQPIDLLYKSNENLSSQGTFQAALSPLKSPCLGMSLSLKGLKGLAGKSLSSKAPYFFLKQGSFIIPLRALRAHIWRNQTPEKRRYQEKELVTLKSYQYCDSLLFYPTSTSIRFIDPLCYSFSLMEINKLKTPSPKYVNFPLL